VPATGLKGISEREIKMAERLIDEMTDTWKPERYHDEYKDELLAFIKKRGRAGQLEAAPEDEEEKPARKARAEVIDIADLLQKSLAAKGSRRGRGKSADDGKPDARGKSEERRRPRRRQTA
jgi:DNA end-binding protein Ku